MSNNEISRYLALNQLAEQNGIVIFGGTEDREIPLCELKQAFELQERLYNRSLTGLSVRQAAELYDACAAPLDPEIVLLHIGAADVEGFAAAPSEFDQNYRELISRIRANNKKCRIAIISLRNPEHDGTIAKLNTHLKYIAESEQCEFSDIAGKRVWNPKGTKDVVSFIYSVGFVAPLARKRPIYDLIKILFCSEPVV